MQRILELMQYHHYDIAYTECCAYGFNNNVYVQCLKIQCLHYMNKHVEARDIVREVSRTPMSKWMDAEYMQLKEYLKALRIIGELQMAIDASMECWKFKPQDKELGEMVFRCLLEAQEFSRMAQHAKDMFEKTDDTKYLAWSVYCSFLHVHVQSHTHMEEADFTPLNDAEELISKMGEKTIFEFPWVAQLMQMAFIKQKQYQKAIDQNSKRKEYIDSNPPIPPNDETSFENRGFDKKEDILFETAELYRASGDFENAVKVLFDLLVNFNNDSWVYYSLVIRLILFDASDEVSKALEKEFRELITKLQEVAKEKRGPFLAAVALEHGILAKSSDTSDTKALESSFVDALEQYFRLFDTKPACISDVRNLLLAFGGNYSEKTAPRERMLNLTPFQNINGTFMPQRIRLQQEEKLWPSDYAFGKVSPETQKRFAEFLNVRAKESLSLLNGSKKNNKAATNFLRTFICCHQALKSIGEQENASPKSLMESVKLFISTHENTLYLNQGNEGGQREVQIGDDLLLMASHILVDLALREKVESMEHIAYMSQAAALLFQGIAISQYNFQFSLLYIEAMEYLGAFNSIPSIFERLSVKNIQLDSLSHIFLSGASSSCFFKNDAEQSLKVSNYLIRARREAMGLTFKSLEIGNYPKAVELLDFEHRLSSSHQNFVAKVEKFSIDLLELAVTTPKKVLAFLDAHLNEQGGDFHSLLETDFSQLCENYDFTAQASYDFPRGKIVETLNGRLKCSGPVSRIPRQCASSIFYRDEWKSRSDRWMSLRLHMAQFTHSAMRMLSSPKSKSAVKLDSTYICENINEMALDVFCVAMWDFARFTFELTAKVCEFRALENPDAKVMGAYVAPMNGKFEMMQSLWTKQQPGKGKVVSGLYLSQLSQVFSIAMLYTTLLLRSVMESMGAAGGGGNKKAGKSGGGNKKKDSGPSNEALQQLKYLGKNYLALLQSIEKSLEEYCITGPGERTTSDHLFNAQSRIGVAVNANKKFFRDHVYDELYKSQGMSFTKLHQIISSYRQTMKDCL